MIKLRIMRKHINRDRTQPDPLTEVLNEAGFSDVHIESYWNLIPPNHDWAVWINGDRYAMSHSLRNYFSYWAIEEGSRTRFAELLLDEKNKTADIAIIRISKSTPIWEKHGTTFEDWQAARKRDAERAEQDRREGFRTATELAPMLAINQLPDDHPSKQALLSNPDWQAIKQRYNIP